jgi:hypothetical protein
VSPAKEVTAADTAASTVSARGGEFLETRIIPSWTNIPWIGRSPQYLVKREAMNRLYFGDNLKWLSERKEFPDASVDLCTPTQLTKRPKHP